MLCDWLIGVWSVTRLAVHGLVGWSSSLSSIEIVAKLYRSTKELALTCWSSLVHRGLAVFSNKLHASTSTLKYFCSVEDIVA